MLDTEGLIASWNAGAQPIEGYRTEEIVGRHFSAFHTHGDLERSHPEEVLRIAISEGAVTRRRAYVSARTALNSGRACSSRPSGTRRATLSSAKHTSVSVRNPWAEDRGERRAGAPLVVCCRSIRSGSGDLGSRAPQRLPFRTHGWLIGDSESCSSGSVSHRRRSPPR
jgi:hypothetical protein